MIDRKTDARKQWTLAQFYLLRPSTMSALVPEPCRFILGNLAVTLA